MLFLAWGRNFPKSNTTVLSTKQYILGNNIFVQGRLKLTRSIDRKKFAIGDIKRFHAAMIDGVRHRTALCTVTYKACSQSVSQSVTDHSDYYVN